MAEKVKGMKELNAKLRKLQSIADNGNALMAGGQVFLEGAQRRAPVETGYLRDNGLVRKAKKMVEIVFSAFYAIYQEFGTRFMQANPFVRPTIDEDGAKIVEAIGKQLQEEIDQVAGG